MKAVICTSCGAKVSASAGRCPRCRAAFVAPNPAAEAASSKRMLQVAAAIAGAFALVILILWMRSAPALAPSVPARPAAVRAVPTAPSPQPAGEGAAPAVAERPFMDPSATAAVAYGAGNYDDALAQYLAAIEKNPDDAESYSNLGQVLVRLNRPAEALPYFDRAIGLLPNRWTYRFNLARAHGTLGQWEQAVAGYRAAQALFPDDYATAFNLGLALHKQGNEAAAVEAYQKAISLEPTDPSFRMALGISYERLQKPAEAAAAYQAALALQPDAPDAERVRARIAQLTAPPGGPSAPAGDAPVPAGPGGTQQAAGSGTDTQGVR